ncbi:PREDICTED: plant UBX domain-containing protein 11 isoform X2 [Tarenaya hassleriana]|uniref:plant UBX domain-containing protein 11 isoform X2 n=1 Tax=Tarenaya hassleriana TaxID=28532 RepID=UPI00053C1CDC|nr:PREDICTED: plant UBX domain-containing protein 11 isoform X2 [Tarenaya hassleriana]
MEAVSSLAFKGSIPEAIFEAKRQKKLFVVYISGEDAESAKLSESTWADAKVAESLSKCCVLLHIKSESADAANFSAIYPYSSVPCIAAIGFNGAQVWRNEGFLTAEVLASSLEKAWLSLHIQETTANILSAALVSQKSDVSSSRVPDVALPSEGGSSDAAVASPSTGLSVQPLERELTVTSGSTKGKAACKNEKVVDNKDCSKSVESSNSDDIANDQPATSVETAKDFGNVELKETSLHFEAEKELLRPETAILKHDASGNSAVRDSCAGERDIKSVNLIGTEKAANSVDDGADDKGTKKKDSVLSVETSSDVHLNIRLPDGASLREKFSVTNTLGMVKDYVSSNQTNGISAFDLAIPYPRKVFNDQDMDKSLSEVGLFNRQALIVVPRQRATMANSTHTRATATDSRSENPNNVGYFAFVRRLISYANPFSYFSGGASSSSSGPESQTSMWEYRPNPGLRNNLGQMGRQDRDSSSTRDMSEGTSNVRNRRQTTSRIGTNIHTLKHDEDDDVPFGGGNTFWNGNSTQYGGDNNDNRR